MAAFASSYIKTEGSQVTRAADAASMTGANFSSWYNQAEGTVYSEWASAGSLGNSLLSFAISNGSFNNSIFLTSAASGASNQSTLAVIYNGASQGTVIVAGAYVNNSVRRTAAAFQVNNIVMAATGALSFVDTSATLPLVNRLSLGANWPGTGNFLNGHLRKLSYYPNRLSDTNLVALTS